MDKGLAIGIDLGTTYSAVSVMDEYGDPFVLKNEDGNSLTPSVIAFDENGSYLVGTEAKALMQHGSEYVACFFKRQMGSEWSFNAYGKSYSATDLSALLLKKLREDAEEALGYEVHQAVITVPAYFDEPRLKATKEAAEKAGLTVLRLLREPTAAAIYYGIAKNVDQKILVYDLGGGTFDVTVLEVENGDFKVRGTDGDHQLGGKDWDEVLFDYLVNQFQQDTGIDLKDDIKSWNELLIKAEQVKRQLTSGSVAFVTLKNGNTQVKYEITRETFESLTKQLMDRTVKKADQLLKDISVQWDDLTGVLLVGGSTMMPMVKSWIMSKTGKEPLGGVNVVEAVCLGAGLVAGMLSKSGKPIFTLKDSVSEESNIFLMPNGHKVKIQDVMGHSLGAISENKDEGRYVNTIIIRKNQKIPAVATKEFYKKTYSGRPNKMDLYLTQGEARDITDPDCQIVRHYEISGYDYQQGMTKIQLKYYYDVNGLIHVEAMQMESQRPLLVQEVPIGDVSFLYEPQEVRKTPVNIMLAIDVSGSMKHNNRIKHARQAAMKFIDEIDLDTMAVAIVTFHCFCYLLCDMSHDVNLLRRAIDGLDAQNMGTSANPIKYGYEMLGKLDDKRLMIVLTDGLWEHKHQAEKYSQLCRNLDIDIIGVGIGEADEAFLRKISTISKWSDLEHLEESFGTIAQEINEHRGASGIFI